MIRYAYFSLFFFAFTACVMAQTVDEYGSVHYGMDLYKHYTAVPFDPPGWSNDTILSDNDAAESIYPDIELDSGNNIHVVWKDNRFSTNGIFYRKFDGATWSSIIDLSDPGINSNSPTIAVDAENNVHVVFLRWSGVPYAHYNMSYKRFDDSSSVWSAETVLTTDDSLGLSARPKVVTDTNLNVYAFWLDERDNPITIWYKVHDGSSWSADIPLTDSMASPNGYFGVAVAPNDFVHVCWQDYRSGIAEIYHRYFNGASWSAEAAVTSNGFLSVYPRMAPDSSSNLHLFYGGATHLRYLMWDAQAQTWVNSQDFPTQFTSPHADIAVDLLTGDRHVVFADYIGYSVIFYKKYDAASSQWEPDLQLTTATDGSYEPQVATDINNLVYLVWYDYRCGTGQEEIFFKQSLITGAGEDRNPVIPQSNELLIPSLVRGTTCYSYTIENEGPYSVSIYSLDGRLMNSVERYSSGTFVDQLPPLPTGIYFLRLEQNSTSLVEKFAILR